MESRIVRGLVGISSNPLAITAETLVNYDPRKGLVILMDASERFWALIVCKAELVNIRKQDIRLLHPKPMICLSEILKGLSLVGTSRKNVH